jgi:diguanylate cyclase (GGDEF)-like protein
MDIQGYNQFSEQFVPMTCVLSVEVFPDGNYGNIRIVTGNAPYVASIEQPHTINASGGFKPKQFVPDTPYTDYIPRDLNFETYVYQCAVGRRPLHTYIKPERFRFWMELYFFPLRSNKENVFYCTYTQMLSEEPQSESMADLSYESASDVLRTCVKLRNSKDFQKTMDDVVKDIRAYCGANQCVIMLMDFNHRTCSVLCEDLEDDDERIRSIRDIMGADFFEVVETWTDAIGGSSCLIVKDKHDWNTVRERSQEWYDHMKLNHVDSLVLFPLRYGKELLGYIWAVNFDVENVVRIKETLELTTFFLASEIANQQLVKRLESLSSIDLLTGILNRNAMNNRVMQLDPTMERPTRSCGIVFADLNGLRLLNDGEGHYAGDMLLKKAALVLQQIFVGNEIYRAGGDEFMIIAVDITEAELERRVERLRKHSAEGGVSFAVGSAYDSDGRDIRRTIRLADERMYEDKALYYRLHPDRMR